MIYIMNDIEISEEEFAKEIEKGLTKKEDLAECLIWMKNMANKQNTDKPIIEWELNNNIYKIWE